MRRRSTSAGPVRLRMSIGVHSGAVPLLPRRRHPPRADRRRGRRDACVATEAVGAGGRDRAQRVRRPRCSTRELLGESRDGVVLLAHAPDVAEMVPPFFDPSGVDLSELLPAAYTRELRGEPADPEHRHVAVAFVEIRETDALLEREGPEALADALEERITAIQESCLRVRRHLRADRRQHGARSRRSCSRAPRAPRVARRRS